MTQRALVRIERTRTALEAFGAESDAWFERRRERDGVRQHHTQLGTLEAVLGRAADGLRTELDGIDARDPVGSVYRSCTQLESGLLWIRRVWSFYRDRFDQRDDPQTAPVLKAADEVVWSCWSTAVRRSRMNAGDRRLPTAPLAYVDDVYAPEARVRDEPPSSLRLPRGVGPEVRAALDDFLQSLPIPMVALPAECISAPWWVVHLGHEVGHHVLPDLEARGAVARRIEHAVAEAAGDAEAASRWRAWSEEVFCDVYHACCLGSAALAAMVELETREPTEMLRREARYPPRLVRLSLLEGAVRELGLDPEPAIGELDPATALDGPPLLDDGVDLRGRAAADHALVPAVIGVVLDRSGDHVPDLRTLTDWSAEDFRQTVRHWREGLRGRTGLYPEASPEGARRMAAATFLAWGDVAAIAEGPRRREEAAALRERALEAIAACREEGTRAGRQAEATDVERLGERLRALALLAHPGEEGA